MLVVYWLALAAGTHWPRLVVPAPPGVSFFDKIIHITAWAGLTLLISHALAGRTRRPGKRDVLIAMVVAVLYATLDEWTQGFVPDRTLTWYDVMANTVGVLLAGWWMMREPIAAWWSRCNTWIARGLLAVFLPAVLYAAFATNFTVWYFFSLNDFKRWADWPRDQNVPVDDAGHIVLTAILTILLPAARLFGSRKLVIKNAALVLFMILSAFIVEAVQSMIGRNVEMKDIVHHMWGVGIGLVLWSMYAAIKERGGENARRGAKEVGRQEKLTSQVSGASGASAGGGFVGHALTVSLLTLVSRVTGLVRDTVVSSTFGLTGVLSAFTIGFMIPNLFRRLFGEGALTSAFIPTYTELLKKDEKAAARLASLTIAVLLLVTGALTLIGIGVLGFMHEGGRWPNDSALAIELTAIMLPFMPLICIVALLGGICQVHRRFGPPAAAPIILNIVIIIATVFITNAYHENLRDDQRITFIAWSVVASGVLQLLWIMVAVTRCETFTLHCRDALGHLKPIVGMMLPMVLGLAVFQINTLLDTFIAFGLAPSESGPSTFSLFGSQWEYPIQDRGAPAALYLAQRLYQFPLGVFGIAIATAIYPALAHAAAERKASRETSMTDASVRDEFRTILQHGIRLTMFIGLPASVGLILVRLPLTRIIFERNAIDIAGSQRIALLLMGYSSAVWAYSTTHVVTRAFHAMKDATTPLKIAGLMVLLNLTLNLTLIWFLGEVGLAWSSAASASLQIVLLLFAVRKYTGAPVDADVWRSWGRTAILTALMAAGITPLLWVVDPATAGKGDTFMLLALMVTLGGLIYAGGAAILKAPELKWLIKRDAA